jgi:hypothetical protein
VVRTGLVGDRRIGVEPLVGFFGAGAYRAGDLVPSVPVEPCICHHLGQEPLGLVDEARDQDEGGAVLVEPCAAAPGEFGERVADQVVGVVPAGGTSGTAQLAQTPVTGLAGDLCGQVASR